MMDPHTTAGATEAHAPVHDWLRALRVSLVPGADVTPLLGRFADALAPAFERLGHRVDEVPTDATDVILTTAPFGRPLSWRRAMLFTAPRRFGLTRRPTVVTALHATREELAALLGRLERALAADPPDLDALSFPGLAPEASQVLLEQGRRGGPILAALRVMQGQAKCIRLVLVVGNDDVEEAYTFDLVGAHPRSIGSLEAICADIAMRVAVAESARSVSDHVYVQPPVPAATWARLNTPRAMARAARELDVRAFFTPMLVVSELVQVPAVAAAVASQYSEGCYSTWDPDLEALIATVTGSASPVNKGQITSDDLAVLVGVREDGRGALVRPVEGLKNNPPSSEALEMMDMDAALPRVEAGASGGRVLAPVIRSKLHGHRGISAYAPEHVEYAPMDPAYHRYPVTCGSDAQARGIRDAFARADSLRNPADPRRVVFTVLPGHGCVIAEKWVPGSEPFRTICECMDAGHLVVDRLVPQGPFGYADDGHGRRVLIEPPTE